MARMDAVVGYVRKSKNRLDVLRVLGSSVSTTNKIAAKTHLNVSTVRSVVNDLRKKGLVKLAVMKATRPMIYEITGLGSAVLRMRNAAGRIRWKGTNKQKRIARRVKERLHQL